MEKKHFILDTNVVLHDSSCIYEFDEHDVTIPITVLEELDNFKKGNDSVNFHARHFLRTLDSLSEDRLVNGGLSLGEGKGKLRVALDRPFHQKLAINFSTDSMDHHILNIAYYMSEHPENDASVILITKDANLRMKAKSLGLMAQDYTTDHVKDLDGLYLGYRTEEGISEEVIDKLYQVPYQVEEDEIKMERDPYPHEYFILKANKKSALVKYSADEGLYEKIDKRDAYGINPRNAEQTFALDALLNPDVKLVTVTGKAGTGKTLLALAAGLSNRSMYRQIFMARPVVPLSNRDIGFLPGDIGSKLDPYMKPLFDNLSVIQSQYDDSDQRSQKISDMLEREKLIISPLSYIRGRSLVKIYFIVDEAQNLTPHEIKTIITRAGEGTKIVFTGDIYQIDHPYLDSNSNGLSYVIDRMKGQKLYSHVDLQKGERSELAEIASDLL